MTWALVQTSFVGAAAPAHNGSHSNPTIHWPTTEAQPGRDVGCEFLRRNPRGDTPVMSQAKVIIITIGRRCIALKPVRNSDMRRSAAFLSSTLRVPSTRFPRRPLALLLAAAPWTYGRVLGSQTERFPFSVTLELADSKPQEPPLSKESQAG